MPLPVASLSLSWSIPASLAVLLSVFMIVRGVSQRIAARADAARTEGRISIRGTGERSAGHVRRAGILLSINLDNDNETWTILMAVHRFIQLSSGTDQGHVLGDLYVEVTSSGSTDVSTGGYLLS
ncbi:unnamed protein product, partial [Ectocarpus fasciculatus]